MSMVNDTDQGVWMEKIEKFVEFFKFFFFFNEWNLKDLL